METFHRTLMNLTVIDGHVVCTDGRPYDREAYSRFKYGFIPPAIEYANGLAELIADEFWQINAGRPVRIVSAPYKYLPTASQVVAGYLLQVLSIQALSRGFEPPVLVPFHKARAGSSAYAKSSQADRLKSLATLGLHIDESLVPDSVMIVVDDIRITGSAERATAAYLEPMAPASVWYLHAARLSEDVAMAHPGLEDELNQSVPHTLDEIIDQVNNGTFQLNTRVLRLTLETPDEIEFRAFVDRAPAPLLEEMHQAAVGSGLAYYQRYPLNLQLLSQALSRRGRTLPQPVFQ